MLSKTDVFEVSEEPDATARPMWMLEPIGMLREPTDVQFTPSLDLYPVSVFSARTTRTQRYGAIPASLLEMEAL